jgi:hypothetical protein
MNKNLRKTLLCVLPFLLLSCSKNQAKAITIDEGSSLIKTALEKDDANPSPLKWTTYTFKSEITAPKELQADLPYLSLYVTYRSDPAYLTTIHRVTASSDDTYIISKDTQSTTPVYSVQTNGGSPVAYDLIKDAYIYNFFELPNYILNENIYGLQRAESFLSLVSGNNENKLTSYNLTSKGGGNLDMTLRGDTLDFSQLFTETPQINTNVTSIRFVLDSFLLQSLEASYLVSPAQTPGLTSSSSSLKGQKAASSSAQGTSCSITMAFGYGVTL